MRRLAYFVKKHLGFDQTQFAAMPWHEQRMWIEELCADPGVPLELVQESTDVAGLGFTMREV